MREKNLIPSFVNQIELQTACTIPLASPRAEQMRHAELFLCQA